MTKAIEVKNLTKQFKDKLAVNDISLNIEEGQLFALLGVNGAGKTTTIKMLSCLTIPTRGEILIFGHNMKSETNIIKSMINISPQETAIAGNLTVMENLEFIAGIYGYSKEESRTKSNEMIEKFSLQEVANRKAKLLSGGWQRRLSIAMGLITDPKILFLDEPTLGLDVLARRELWKIIESLKGKITIILTTHYMEEAEALSDKLAIMVNGKIVDAGTAKEMIEKTKAKNFEDAFVAIATNLEVQ